MHPPRRLVLLVTWLCLSLGVSCDNKTVSKPRPRPYDECDKPSDEFFYLVLQWPAGFCKTEHCARNPPERFTIHGLWPNYCQDRHGKDWPEFCSGDRFDESIISDLIDQMDYSWPSLTSPDNSGFWKHEWGKHGTCALSYTPFGLDSQYEYFKTTLDLNKDFDLYNVLVEDEITPGGKYPVSKLQAAFTDALGGDVYLHCDQSNTLVEVFVCYNQRLERVPCTLQGVCKNSTPVVFASPEQLAAF